MTTKSGTLIEEHDELFAEWFEEPVEIRNYLDDSESGFDVEDEPYAQAPPDDARTAHPDNPIETTAQFDTPEDPRDAEKAWGKNVTVDVEVYMGADVLIGTAGDTDDQGRELGASSTITRLDTGQEYVVQGVVGEGQGQQRIAAKTNDS